MWIWPFQFPNYLIIIFNFHALSRKNAGRLTDYVFLFYLTGRCSIWPCFQTLLICDIDIEVCRCQICIYWSNDIIWSILFIIIILRGQIGFAILSTEISSELANDTTDDFSLDGLCWLDNIINVSLFLTNVAYNNKWLQKGFSFRSWYWCLLMHGQITFKYTDVSS